MSFLDKFLNVMRLNPDDEDDEFYNDDYYDDEDDEELANEKSFKSRREKEDSESEKFKPVRTTSKVTPMRASKKQSTSGMEVCVIKPTSFDDSREITDTLLNNRTVVLNVEGLDLEIAQRIIDFAAGSTYAIRGNLQKISNYIFIITPGSVDISGDLLNLVDSFDTKGLKTDF